MKALYFQHRNAVLMHVETVHENCTLTLTATPGGAAFITCPQSDTPRIGHARLIPDEPAAPPEPAAVDPVDPPDEPQAET